ncbi:MAG: choice-of-anchor Q domain-containing protein [Rhodanobacteraceae bacterium]
MSSTIVASNDTDNGVNDISIPPLANSVTVDGSNNLVMNWTGAVTLPVDTLTGDPALLQLTTDDGGLTATHPLSAGSVAIDAGSNPDVLGCDQRGYPYHRVQGSAADIGAYEAQGERHLFADGFDGSADCPSAAP